MLQRLKKFGKLSLNEQLIFSEALFLQLSVGLLLKVIPFKWIPKLYPNPSRLNPDASRLIPEQIKKASQRAAAISPWKNKCLVQSLAARRMLQRRKISSLLSLGVKSRPNKRMIAHAWLKAGDIEIVEKSGDYYELYIF